MSGSDFDNSDDDLADLLNDDDDDIYAKKLSSNTNTQNKTTKSPNISPKKVTDQTSGGRKKSLAQNLSTERKNSTELSSVKSPSKLVSAKRDSKAFADDALSEFLNQSSLKLKTKTSTPVKISSDDEETKYLDELGFSKLSNKTTSSKNDNDANLLKDEGNDFSDDDDILKSLDSDGDDKSAPTSPRKRSGSFFDDFLKKLSPKHSAKKSTSEQIKDVSKYDSPKADVEDSKLSENNKSTHLPKGNIQKRRESLLKQVSFKESDELLQSTSFVKEKSSTFGNQPVKKDFESKSSNSSLPPSKRLEKMASSKEEDGMDWSNFFKESPKKSSSSAKTPAKKDDLDEISLSNKLSSRRKSSSAEWLGLSEPNTPSKTNLALSESKKSLNQNDSNWLDSGEAADTLRSQSAKSLNHPRRSRGTPALDTSWLGEEFQTALPEKNKIPIESEIQPSAMQEKQLVNKISDIKSKKENVRQELRDGFGAIKNTASVKPALEEEIHSVHTVYAPKINTQGNESIILSSKILDIRQTADELNLLPVKTTGINENINMQTLLNYHVLEKEQLIKSSETMKLMYEEQIKSMEALHKGQLKSIEESFEALENNLKKEMDDKIQDLEEKLNSTKKEKEVVEKSMKNKLTDIEKEHLKEIQKLKELHSFSVAQMKQDHEDALKRLNRLKEQEVEAVLSTQAHSNSLQHLTDQLKVCISESAMLQTKVEEKNQANLREKQLFLESKEKDLKALQNRIQRQLEDGDEERARLQQLILRLESRLQKYASEGEEDRWEVQQMKAKLTVQQKYLDEEYKLKMVQIEREKEKLQMNQNSLLQEQKIVLLQLAQERQQLTQEKLDMDLLSKKIKDEEATFNVKKLKEESYIEREKQFIRQEENRIFSERNNLKLESQQFEKEKDLFEREKQQFMNEKEKFNEYSLKIRRKADEVEHLAMSATEEKERVRLEQSAAVKMKNEYQLKYQHIAQQMQSLMEKEHQILQEKEKLSEERYELENKKNSVVCVKCKLSSQLPLNVQSQNVNASPLMTYPIVTGMTSQMPQTFFDPTLVLWQVSAQKDHAFMEEELLYLKSLKESSKKADK